MATFTWLLLAALAAGLLYGFVVRRWLLAWGAAPAELGKRLPGDEILPDAPSACTRAITIHAPPVRAVARDRALVLGGDGIPAQHIPPTTWVFVLEPADRNQTRLLIRWRSQTPRSLHDLVFNKYLLEPIHFIMERKMMLGIRRRAETQIELR